MQENIKPIQVKMTDRRYVRTEPIYQYDVGHTLDLSVFAAMLPETFQVHFGRSLMGDSITQIGQHCSCPVPDMYAQTAAPIYAWLYIADDEIGLTKYTVEIPVQRRARITDQEPTPVERSAIDQEIAALNAGVERAETAAEAAEAAQAGAEAAEQGASAAEDSAGASAALAAQKAELATREADRAEAAEGIVEQAARDAVEDVTEVAEQAAVDLGGIVRDAQTQIAGSVQQAQQAAQAASGSATAAEGSAGAAAGSATAADQSAQAAAQKKEQMDVRADEIEDELTLLKSDIESKQNKPVTPGTEGQVLSLDGEGNPVWTTVQTESEIDDTAGEGVTDKAWSADKLVSELQDKADVIISSASGAIASFPDGAAAPVEKLVVNVEPVQDLHGYDSPWPAGGGKNKLNGQVVVNAYPSVSECTTELTPGTYVLSLSVSNATSWRIAIKPTVDDAIAQDAISVSSPSGYYWNENAKVYLAGSNGVISAIVFVVNLACKLGFCIVLGDVTASTKVSNAQVEEGSTPTAYAPYENICPIMGWTGANVFGAGKNLLPSINETQIISGITWTKNADGSVTLIGTSTENSVYDFGRNSLILKAGTYTTKERTNDDVALTLFHTVNGTVSVLLPGGGTFTLTQDEPIFLRYFVASGKTVSKTIYPQIELGSAATDYEPYSGQTYQITIPADPGIVYGGKLTVNRDGTGTLKAEQASVLMSDLTDWGVSTLSTGVMRSYVPNIKIPIASHIATTAIMDRREAKAWSPLTANDNDKFGISPNSQVVIPMGREVESIESFLNEYGSAQLVYPLDTPQTYTLTADQVTTLLGTNNIWSDAGDVEVTYRADTKLYIDNKLAELVAQIVNS